jgi:6-phosphogluconolactonase
MMLTGGNTAKQLYQHWTVSKSWNHSKIIYYFGDERCVPPDHQDSNYGMVKRSLFPKGIPKGCKVIRMEGELSERETAARNYEQMLPESIDILLFSVGSDGHIASLFPRSNALNETKSVVPVVGPKPPSERLTITTSVIQSAKSTFLFAQGKEKGQILAQALESRNNIASFPVRLVLEATWILDTDAAEQLSKNRL